MLVQKVVAPGGETSWTVVGKAATHEAHRSPLLPGGRARRASQCPCVAVPLRRDARAALFEAVGCSSRDKRSPPIPTTPCAGGHVANGEESSIR